MFKENGINVIMAQNITQDRAEEIAASFDGNRVVKAVVAENEPNDAVGYWEIIEG